ncbi:PVC-type heme-binding CxxCH protein [Flavihumibacter fluvii]|uniref:PVC-type heme-binding CxxCH protein n=1 Tax=Flavihumibacter fluvii TaxID=2838157 RepID=UPI001BDE34D5|nr:PVC-type heme-binding CxxCH protein [Flavihumibacter fluvii]ULQ53268.1 ThuA domain-containing protein [Flavihumibacter fluvii]
MHKKYSWVFLVFVLLQLLVPGCKHAVDDRPRRIEILFLGHNSEHHNSGVFASILAREYFKEGINITYSTTPDDLNTENLSKYDGLILYANYDSIQPAQEKALLNFVTSGKGFIPLHCASYCFRNSPEVIELIGGQFLSHKVDSFYAVVTDTSHPVMKNVPVFKTTDETYVHHQLSKSIKVLTERVEGTHHEPYTWVREYGDGRVFYTAYGHDEASFNNPGVQQLIKNGILWAVGDKARNRLTALKMPTPVYTDAVIPNYEQRNPPPQLQAALSPAESMLLTQVPVDFELKLFAAEPDIINPIYMNWDEKGRLWVIETVDYPNTVLEDKQKGDDRIKILEDTDGDGKADKITLFADKLNIPTSFTFHKNGIIVSQAPYFISLQDLNGDDKADQRDTIMTGWGVFDTHAGPSNLRYGFDNTIWGTVGYSGFKGKVGNDSMEFSMGLYHFQQDGQQLEFLSTTSNNTWGLGFSEEFDVFISTANNTHSGFYGLPKKVLDLALDKKTGIDKIDNHYAMHVVTKNLRQVDVFGGFTAAAGHNLYTARNFPREYWNRVAFVCEPTGRLIHQHVLEKNGAGFKEKGDGWNILASADEWMGPIQAEVGPDGALWVADWYNFIIQHNPTPPGFGNGKGNAHINPLRDHDRGRIYRIVYKNAKPSNLTSLDKKDSKALVKALSDDNMFWRMHAQRLLVEAGNTTVLPALYKIVKDESLDEAGINAPAIHALWTMHGLHAMNGDNQQALDVALKALQHPAAGVRKAAIQVLPGNAALTGQLKTAGVFKDKDLRVRLAALLALSGFPESVEKTDIIADMARQPDNINDRWIKEALEILSPTTIVEPAITAAAEPNAKFDQLIRLKVVKEAMKYDQQKFSVKAGSTIKIELQNPDFMQHNLLVLQPGTIDKVGAAADELAKSPAGITQQYVPKMPEVLASTPLINPGGTYAFILKVPGTPGDYPYICSFPGHWRIMKGIMQVIK